MPSSTRISMITKYITLKMKWGCIRGMEGTPTVYFIFMHDPTQLLKVKNVTPTWHFLPFLLYNQLRNYEE